MNERTLEETESGYSADESSSESEKEKDTKKKQPQARKVARGKKIPAGASGKLTASRGVKERGPAKKLNERKQGNQRKQYATAKEMKSAAPIACANSADAADAGARSTVSTSRAGKRSAMKASVAVNVQALGGTFVLSSNPQMLSPSLRPCLTLIGWLADRKRPVCLLCGLICCHDLLVPLRHFIREHPEVIQQPLEDPVHSAVAQATDSSGSSQTDEKHCTRARTKRRKH